MKTLIYKRTHNGDPDPDSGVFGNNGCVKSVRTWKFEAIIGIGGIGSKANQNGIARKLTWVGIGPKKAGINKKDNYPILIFNNFLYFGEAGPLLEDESPELAKRIYDGGVRLIWNTSLSKTGRKEVEEILDRAKNAPPSGRIKRTLHLNNEKMRGHDQSNSCYRNSSSHKA